MTNKCSKAFEILVGGQPMGTAPGRRHTTTGSSKASGSAGGTDRPFTSNHQSRGGRSKGRALRPARPASPEFGDFFSRET